MGTHPIFESDFDCLTDKMAGNAIFNGFDAFSDQNTDNISPQKDVVHIRIQQRNGRKTLTTVQGLSEEYDLKKIIKVCKRHFACNGTVVDHSEWGEVIQFQGDQRDNISRFLLGVKLARVDQVKIMVFNQIALDHFPMIPV